MAEEDEERPTMGQPAPSTPRRIPDGRLPGTLISRHSMCASATGPGEKVVINVENLISALGKNSSLPKQIIEVPTSLFLPLTKNKSTVYYITRRIKKYMMVL